MNVSRLLDKPLTTERNVKCRRGLHLIFNCHADHSSYYNSQMNWRPVGSSALVPALGSSPASRLRRHRALPSPSRFNTQWPPLVSFADRFPTDVGRRYTPINGLLRLSLERVLFDWTRGVGGGWDRRQSVHKIELFHENMKKHYKKFPRKHALVERSTTTSPPLPLLRVGKTTVQQQNFSQNLRQKTAFANDKLSKYEKVEQQTGWRCMVLS